MYPEKLRDFNDDDDDADLMETLETLMGDKDTDRSKISETSTSSKVSNCTPSTSKNYNIEWDLNKSIETEKSKCAAEEKENKSVANRSSMLHSGDTDSEDEEDKKYSFEAKYSESGRALKKLLNHKSEEKTIGPPEKRSFSRFSSWQKTPIISSPSTSTFYEGNKDTLLGMRLMNPLVSSAAIQEKMIGRELISLARLKHHVANGKATSTDWVVAGVIVSKSTMKTSQKGAQYIIWKLSDLKGDLKTFSLFLFRNAAKELWKTNEGTAIAVLNASILDTRDGSGDEATLSVDNVQKVMNLGTSKDLGFCKARKKNGENCKAFVNKYHCEYCIYHIQQEYKKCSRRSELQPTAPKKGLIDIRNKVLGKHEVFYAGKSFSAIPAKRNVKQQEKDNRTLKSLFGTKTSTSSVATRFGSLLTTSFSPNTQKSSQVLSAKTLPQASTSAQKNIPEASPSAQKCSQMSSAKSLSPVLPGAQKSTKTLHSAAPQSDRQIETDAKRLETLSAGSDFDGPISAHKSSTPNLPSASKSYCQVKTEAKRKKISHLGVDSQCPSRALKSPSPTESKGQQVLLHNNIGSTKKTSIGVPQIGRPQLSCDGNGQIDFGIDLLVSPSVMQKEKAKINALRYIKQHGPLKKENPNSLKKDEKTKKRKFDEASSAACALETPETSSAEQNIIKSSMFKELMNAESKHTELLKANEERAQDDYFDKLEKKERLELKMLETYKISCKAVRCLKCKYTALSASELCKVERHPLKIQDAMKRFFKCGNCNNRTMSLDLIPLHSCGNCSGSNWIRAPMLRESKRTNLNVQPLSIRGDEETYIGSIANEGNINLLVSDADPK